MDPSFALMLEKSLEDGLKELGFSKLFIQELANAVMRVNYGQLADAHQFVGNKSLFALIEPLLRMYSRAVEMIFLKCIVFIETLLEF